MWYHLLEYDTLFLTKHAHVFLSSLIDRVTGEHDVLFVLEKLHLFEESFIVALGETLHKRGTLPAVDRRISRVDTPQEVMDSGELRFQDSPVQEWQTFLRDILELTPVCTVEFKSMNFNFEIAT